MSYLSIFGALIPIAMAVIVGVDVILGARAEYLNATAIVEGWASLLRTGVVRSTHVMFWGDAAFGGAARLGLGTGLWALEAAAASALIALPIWLVVR
ncbi:MAG: hypothetical protein H6719_00125 [Sandaracinaceae bacterium]|nr:hypothetical protein [Sandaracinaceae bacterium]